MSRNGLIPNIVHEQFAYFCYLRKTGLTGIMMFYLVNGKDRFQCIGTGGYFMTPRPDNDAMRNGYG